LPVFLPPYSPYQAQALPGLHGGAWRVDGSFSENGPVADTISPIWHDEKARDAAGEPSQ
jgi:hypothetical protein